MDLADLIRPEAVSPTLKVGSKRQLLQELAARAARLTGLPERDLLDHLNGRERLESTAVGHGIAIPHAMVAGLDCGVALFARLDKPIDFDATDGQPVDLVCVLLTPEGAGADHLKALARIARVLRDASLLAKLRVAEDRDVLYALLVHPMEPQAPAAARRVS